MSLATLGIDARGGSDYGGHEPRHLMAAESIVDGGRLDAPPHGIGFPLLISPAYALGGPKLVEVFLALVAALAFVLAAALARRLVPEPWATGGVAAVALSTPAVAYGATVYPELAAGALLAGAALLALRVRERPSAREALAAALLIALLPWLGTAYLVPGLPILAAMGRWLVRRGRRLQALLAAELVAGSIIAYASVNQALYGRPTPGAETFALGGAERLPRLVALWLDRGDGLLRWAPVGALAFLAVWLLWRSRRERLARAVPGVRDREAAATLLLAVCAGQVLVAAFAAPALSGPWFPGRHLVAALPCAAALAAWGLRHRPRAGVALALLSLTGTAWLLVQLRTGAVDGWVAPDSRAPWGPLVDAFPDYGAGSAWADAVAVAVAAGLLGLAAREALALRGRRGRSA